MKAIKKLGFIVNAAKPEAVKLSKELVQVARDYGVECEAETSYPMPKDFLEGMEACCVIGGDGTILSTVPECLKRSIPVFGINQGKLGFLATFSVNEVKKSFQGILSGNYSLEKRFVLKAKLGSGQEYFALNDVVVKHMAPSRMMEMEVYANDEYMTSYSGDGLIISTPTGSTAYNLSAGGPIVYPGATVLIMTPICPHTLTNRAVIFDNSNELTVKLCQNEEGHEEDAIISLDGQILPAEETKFPLTVKIAEETLMLLHPVNYSHFKTLRNKLRWGD